MTFKVPEELAKVSEGERLEKQRTKEVKCNNRHRSGIKFFFNLHPVVWLTLAVLFLLSVYSSRLI